MPNYGRMLEGLRRAPLLTDADFYQEDFLTAPDPASGQPASNMTGFRRKDPSLTLDSFNQGMTAELRDRIFKNERLAGFGDPSQRAQRVGEVNALKNLLGSYEDDIKSSPLADQRQEVDSIREANLGSRLAGFDTPQAAGVYKREQDRLKLESPLREAEVRGQTAIDQARAQTEGAVRLENTRSRNMMDYLRQAQTGGGDLAAVGRSGTGGYVRFQNQQDPKALGGTASLGNALTNAKNYYASRVGTKDEAGAAAGLESAINQYLNAREDIHEGNRNLAYNLAKNPAFASFPDFQTIRQAIQMDPAAATMTDQDWLEVEQLWRAIK